MPHTAPRLDKSVGMTRVALWSAAGAVPGTALRVGLIDVHHHAWLPFA